MEEKFDEWSVLELFGHRRMAGKISEVTMFGGTLLRIDVPGEGTTWTTQFYGTSAIYCLTPTTEAVARECAKRWQPAPVNRWELQIPERTTRRGDEDDER